MMNKETTASAPKRITILAKLLLAGLFALVMLIGACKKTSNKQVSVATAITVYELYKYQIVEEYVPKPAFVNELGPHPILYVSVIGGDEDKGTIYVSVRDTRMWHLYPQSAEPVVSYDESTGITKLLSAMGHFELTRDANNQIILLGGHRFSDAYKAIENKYALTEAKLVKVNNYIYLNRTYKDLEGGNTFYRFAESKWHYKQQTPSALNELTWDFVKFGNLLWQGKDNGTAKYNNLFVIIPGGNGWKGKYQNQDILLVNTRDDAGIAKGKVGIYGLYN